MNHFDKSKSVAFSLLFSIEYSNIPTAEEFRCYPDILSYYPLLIFIFFKIFVRAIILTYYQSVVSTAIDRH